MQALLTLIATAFFALSIGGLVTANAAEVTFEYSGQIVGVGSGVVDEVPIREGDLWSLRYTFDTEVPPDFDFGDEAEYPTISMVLTIESSPILVIPISDGHINLGNDISQIGDFYTVRVPAAINGSPFNLVFGSISLSLVQFSLRDPTSNAFSDTSLPNDLQVPSDFLPSNFQSLEEFFADSSQYSFFHLAFTTGENPGSPIPSSRIVGNIQAAQVVTPEASSIQIDIKPGNKQNKLDPNSRSGIWVAVLSDTSPESPFDPSSQVNIPSVDFGPDGAKAIRHKLRDINKDGLRDLLLQFRIRDTGILCGDTEATLTGEDFDEQAFAGSDAIITVKCP